MLSKTLSKTLNIVAVHRIDRTDRLPLPEGWGVWATDTEIGQTYKELAMHAVEAQWDHNIIVVQDDVRFTTDPSEANPNGIAVLAYGQTKRDGHICPRAFSANPNGWKMLEKVWLPAPNTLCPGFTRVVMQAGTVLDWTSHG